MRLLGSRTALVLVAAVSLSACSLPWSGPDAQEAADDLAAALSSGKLTALDVVGGAAGRTEAAESYADLTRGMDSEPEVSAGEVSADGDSATATLDWSWEIGEKQWAYETTARLTKRATGDGEAWLVRWAPALVQPSLEQGERLVESSVAAERGLVVGKDDVPIVKPRPVVRAGLDKTGLTAPQAAASAREVATLLDIDVPAFVKLAQAAGARAFVQGIVYRKQDAPAAVLSGLADIDGGAAVADELPLAPTKEFAAPLLGTVGPATAELVEESKGRIRPGDEVGLSGLQKRYDEQLAGTRGATVDAVDQEGERRQLFSLDPVPGRPLRTTIDVGLQSEAEQALAGLGPASALVAIRPSSGAIVAAASGPGSKGYNTATFGRYAPGSTFKVISALALLRSGVTPSTRVSCPPTTVVDGKTFKNYDDYPSAGLGEISFEDALANSCNTAFISQRDRLQGRTLADAAAALGLGVDHDTGFPAFFGQVGEAGSETQAAANLIGQGTVLASPMAMAGVVASVLHGSVVLPRLLPDVETQQTEPARPLTGQEAQQLRTMMRAVVEHGSGSILADVPGPPVIAKTGTAEFGDTPPLPTHAWMVAGQGDLAVAVFVERGDSGSGTAGPVLEQFLRGAQPLG